MITTSSPVKTDGQLATALNKAPVAIDDKNVAEQKNKELSSEELSHISELANSKAFQWFVSECLKKNFDAAFEAMIDPKTDDKDVALARKMFMKTKEIYVWILDREYTVRQVQNSEDPELIRIKCRIDDMTSLR